MAKTTRQKTEQDAPHEIGGEVISIEAEEIPIEEKIGRVITTELEKANVTEAIISNLRGKYMPLKLKDLNDKEGYLEISEARKDMKKWISLTGQVCKKGRESAVLEQKMWINKEKDVSARMGEIRDHLSVQEDAYEANQDRIKLEKKQAQDKAFALRSAELNAFGATFNGSDYILGDVSYELAAIRESDEDLWLTILKPKFEAVFNANEVIRIAAEKEKSDAAAELLRQQKELADKAKEIKDREAAMVAKETELKAQEAARLEAERLAMENHIKQVTKARIGQLKEIGMNYDPHTEMYAAYGYGVSMDEIKSNDPEKWDTQIVFFVEVITKAKENERIDAELAEAARQKQAKIDAEAREKAAAEKAINDERERVKVENEVKLKAQQEAAIKKQQELEAAGDKTKWADLMKQLESVTVPEFRSSQYRGKAKIVRDFLSDLKNQ